MTFRACADFRLLVRGDWYFPGLNCTGDHADCWSTCPNGPLPKEILAMYPDAPLIKRNGEGELPSRGINAKTRI
jgi:hypothetical protein